MIIVEGADLVGKTTFCNKLVQALREHGFIYQHFTRLPPGWDFCHDYRDRMPGNVVQDRFHMSEIVYSRVRGEQPGISSEMYRILDAWQRLHGTVNVVITCEGQMLQERMRQGEMYSFDKILHANHLFSAICREEGDHPFPEYRIDWDYHITCDDRKPFPDDTDLAAVVDLWHQRNLAMWTVQKKLSDRKAARPAVL